ncbi:MAG: Benzoate-CoA ligase [Myxococcaceae bacterium]|nr:Benzoate-CoA ligase [Myxococcaceae bacterium]
MDSPYSRVDISEAPARITVHVPRHYNAAVDFVDRHVAEGRGKNVAFIEDGRSTTYAQLAELVSRAAVAIRGLGVVPEQRVMLCLHDTVDFAGVFFGAIRAGVVPVPVNTMLTTDDYAFMLEDSRARVLFVSDALVEKMQPAIAKQAKPPRVIVVKSPVGAGSHANDEGASPFETRVSRTVRYLELDAVLAASDPSDEVAPTTADDVAFWLYSSGSTGAPKGAIHLHSHLVQTAALYGRGVLGIRESDIVFSAAKLFFAYGLGNALTFPLHVGATAVLMAERPTPAAVMRTLAKHRPTIFCGVPTLYASMLADRTLADAKGSPALRVSISAGEALPKHTGEKWRARFGTDILDGIGSTEMLHIFLSNRPGDVRYGTSGKPVPGYDLKLVDDAGEPAPDGEEGSLWVRGPSSCVGYWNQREKSLANFHGPWTRTGDRYVRDGDGYHTYAGRSDDMLKVGGIWVSPFEVESALSAHDAVLEAAVVGHGDSDGLVKPRAFVVLAEGRTGSETLIAELQAFVKAKLAPYKYPRWIEFTTELPKTATGKIQRFKLRA